MQQLTATWADGTEPVIIGIGNYTNRWGIDEGQIIPAIRSTAGYAAEIMKVSDTEWTTVDPEDASRNRVFVLA